MCSKFGIVHKIFKESAFVYRSLNYTEHYNANLHPPNPEIIEQLFEGGIHYVPVWRMSYWEYILHVYLFMAEFLKEIMDFHPLLIFVWWIPYPMCDPRYIFQTTQIKLKPKYCIFLGKSLYIQFTPQLFLTVYIPNKLRYTSAPNSHNCKPSTEEIPIQQSKRWEVFQLLASLEVIFICADQRYLLI